jgi:biotin carboxyl carrier protein
MRRAAIDDLEIEHGSARLALRRGRATESTAQIHHHLQSGDVAQSADVAASDDASALLTVAAPAVGRFTPRVGAGEHVDVDQLLGALETLGMAVPIKAPWHGYVRDVFAAEIAEFGQVLVTIERSGASSRPGLGA